METNSQSKDNGDKIFELIQEFIDNNPVSSFTYKYHHEKYPEPEGYIIYLQSSSEDSKVS